MTDTMNEKTSLKNLLLRRDTDACIYVIGLVCAPFFALCWFIARRIGLIPDFCVFRAMTGLYCPGCGGSRALLLLFRTDIAGSVIHHPLVIYSFALAVIFYVSQTLRFISRGRMAGFSMRPIFPIIGGALLLLNWLIKNMLLLIWKIALIN